jgi:hypothetical protein
VVQKGAPGSREFNAVHAAGYQRNADFLLEIAYLPAEGRLRRMQAFLCRQGEASLLGDGDEIAEVT